MKKICCQIVFLFFLLQTFQLIAQSPVIALQEFSTGYSSPVDIKSCGDSRLFILQQNGYIYLCDSAGVKNTTPFLDIHTKIIQSSERGLLGLAFHPDYVNNGYFYVYYTRSPDGYLRIARYSTDSLNANAADPNSELILKEIPHPTYANHNGGCLQFGPDGYLYAGTGDGGSGGDPDENAQNTKKYLGKLLRFDVDGGSPYAIPADNPFIADTANYYPEIWAYGLRNPWRYSFDKLTGDLWIGDVGQNTWEEIDFMPLANGGGQNYGWDCYEGTHNYEPGNCATGTVITWPVHEYQHCAGSNCDCSITGGYVYRGGQYANLFGKYIAVDYCSGKFRTTEQNANGTFTTSLAGDEVISQDEFAFSSFGQDQQGELYVANVTNGKIYAITDTACLPVAKILANGIDGVSIDSTVCAGTELQAVTGTGNSYQWQLNGADIIGATSPVLVAGEPGIYTLIVTNTANCTNTSEPVTAGIPAQTGIEAVDPLYCVSQAADTLTGYPSGGIFAGDGMNGDIFYPAAAGIGTHIITYSYENSYGCLSVQSVSIVVDACTGIQDTRDNIECSLFPIPNNGSFSISCSHLVKENTDIRIFSLSGQLIRQYTVAASASGSLHCNVQPLADAMYILRIQTGNDVDFRKLVIEN